MLPKTQPETVRFGVFDVDLRTGHLRKNGVRIKLQEQPFQVLTVLLQRPGEVVTREELRLAIWPADTFVDFDNSLNTAVNRLRQALGDSSDNPRFIETLPRRGYRFIAPVASDAWSAIASSTQVVSRLRGWKILIAGSLLLIGGLVGVLTWRSHRPRHALGKIVLGDFANSTGDRIFDGTLRQGLLVQLQQSPSLKLVSDEQIHQTLRMMGQKTTTPLTLENARGVCQRTDSAIVLSGSIALIGTRYDLTLRAVDCADGDLLASVEAQANDKSNILDALGKVASAISTKLGEPLASVHKYDGLEQVSTQSLEALQFYTQGVTTLKQLGDFDASVTFFQKAVEIDPNFVMAYLALSDTYSALGESASSAKYVGKAFQLRAGVSEWERSLIEALYYLYGTGDLVNARRSLQLYAKMYRNDDYPHDMLASAFEMLGQYPAALNEAREALHLNPFHSYHYRLVAFNYLLAEQVDDATAIAKEAHAKGMDSNLAPVLYAIGFYRHDTAEMTRQVASTTGKVGMEDLLLAMEADSAAYEGHLRKARDLARRAIASAQAGGEKETVACYYAVSALREALSGNGQGARKLAAIAKQRSSGREVNYGVAIALAYAGDTSQAESFANELARNHPDDTVVRFNYLPTIRAKLAVSRSNPQRALDILAVAAPYELGTPAYSLYNWPNLYPVYVRGEAYLAAHRGEDALIEFQKILDHRGIVLNEPIGALVHLQIGRAYAMAGDTARAKAAYQDFLSLWKDADRDIPILEQAKAEYAKLQ